MFMRKPGELIYIWNWTDVSILFRGIPRVSLYSSVILILKALVYKVKGQFLLDCEESATGGFILMFLLSFLSLIWKRQFPCMSFREFLIGQIQPSSSIFSLDICFASFTILFENKHHQCSTLTIINGFLFASMLLLQINI